MVWGAVDAGFSMVMITSGVLLDLAPQWANRTNVTGTPTFSTHTFQHTYLMATLKFAGQFVCLLLYGVLFWRNFGQNDGRRGRRPMPGTETIEKGNDRAKAVARGRINGHEDDDQLPLLQDEAGVGEDVPGRRPIAKTETVVHRQDVEDGERKNGGDGAKDRPNPIRNTRPPLPPPANPNWPPPFHDPTQYNILLFLLPALFDLASQSAWYVGIRLTYKSSYFMLNGAVLFFTALLSVAFLARPLQKQMWAGLALGIIGLGGFGLRDYIKDGSLNYDIYGLAAGDLLLVMSHIMVAIRVVYEEKFTTKHRINPLLAVGLEGMFGFVVSFFITIGFSFINAGAFSKLPRKRLEDPIDAFYQMKSSWQISISVITCIIMIPLYYWTGISLAKSQGSMARSVLDSAKTCIVFFVLLGLQWEAFYFPQLLGVFFVLLGVLVFNEFIFYPMYRRFKGLPVEENILANCQPLGAVRRRPQQENPGAEENRAEA